MPKRRPYDYAVLRIVPCAEREEFVNAGVVVHCPELAFLDCLVQVDEARLRALDPAQEIDPIRQHLEAFPKICAGDPDAGPVAQLSRRERFHWIVAPRSTVIQVSAVHSGVCESPQAVLDELFQRLVGTHLPAQ